MSKAIEALTTSTPSLNRRGLIAAGAAALAGAALLNSPAAATGAFSYSSDFFEIRRLAGLIQEVWKTDLHDDVKAAEVAKLEVDLALIEARILSKRASSISDLLDRAALVYWSDAGHIG